MSENAFLDEYTHIDDLMRKSIKLSKDALQIVYNSNRNIYDLMRGNVITTGLINYEVNTITTLTPEERKKRAKQNSIFIDPRDGKAFYVQKIIVDVYSHNSDGNIRFTPPPYQFNAVPAVNSNFRGYSCVDEIPALGLTSNPFRRDNLMITNVKYMGYHGLFGHDSEQLRVIFGAQTMPPNFAYGLPRAFMNQYNMNILSPTYGISVGNEDVIEFDFSNNPIFLRWDKNDIWFFDYENLSGAEQHFRRAITYCFIEPVTP